MMNYIDMWIENKGEVCADDCEKTLVELEKEWTKWLETEHLKVWSRLRGTAHAPDIPIL